MKQLQGIQWRAMNTKMTIFTPWSDEEKLKGNPVWEFSVIQLVDQFEKHASRFYAHSELKRFEKQPVNEPFSSSRLFGSLLQKSIELHLQTNGWFNPTLGDAMAAIGYDRSFELIESTLASECNLQKRTPSAFFSRFDEDHDELGFRPTSSDHTNWIKDRAVRLDFGGMGKGWIVDQIAQQLRSIWRVPAGLVDAGGDLTVWSEKNEQDFRIDIQHPFEEQDVILEMTIRDGAVATSNRIHRQWKNKDGKWIHHILNPFTGQPVMTKTVQATVHAHDALHADVWAKCMLMMPPEEALSWLKNQAGAKQAWMILESGEIISWTHENNRGDNG
jgi:thiamine biosynthesis lipoprotein